MRQQVDQKNFSPAAHPLDAWEFDPTAWALKLKKPWSIFARLYSKAISFADYTVLDDDGYMVLNVTTGASTRTITLPTAADNTGRVLTICKVDSGAGSITVDGEGSETIGGSLTRIVSGQWQSLTIICDGTNWEVLASSSSGMKVYSVSGDYTVLDGDGYGTILVTTSSTGRTVTLPTAADNNHRIITVVKVDNGTGTVTVDGEGSEYVGVGVSLSFVLLNETDYVTLACDGTRWTVVATSQPEYVYSSDSDVTASSSPTSGSWYNPTSHSLALPEGVYLISARVRVRVTGDDTNPTYVQTLSFCLSNANNTSAYNYLRRSYVSNSANLVGGLSINGIVDYVGYMPMIIEPTRLYFVGTLYLNLRVAYSGGSPNIFGTSGVENRTYIRARRIG